MGKRARPPCGSHGCGVLQHTSTGLLELHEGCSHFQNSCMISEQGPVPTQGSPFVPGSSVESSFNKLFSKVFYFFSTLYYHVSPARLSPYLAERWRCFGCILVAHLNCSLHCRLGVCIENILS